MEWFEQIPDEKKEGGEKDDKSDDVSKPKDSTKDTTNPSSFSPAAIGIILKDDVETVSSTVTNTLANLLRSSSSCIFGTYNMLNINKGLVLYSLAVAPVVGTIAWMTRKYLKKIVIIQQQAAIDSADFVHERLSHIAMVKTSNREDDEVDSYNEIQKKFVKIGEKASLASGLSMGIMFTMSSSAFCSILLVGRRAVKAQQMTAGQLTSFGTYSFMLALGTAGVVKALGEYSKGIQCSHRLYSLIQVVSKNENDQKHVKRDTRDDQPSIETNLVQKISMENVNFSYQTDRSKLILNNISLSLSRGEVVGLCGANGSGKSTIASLLARMYRPTNGDILLCSNSTTGDMTSVLNYTTDINRKDQVQLVQTVPQDPTLFDMTVLDNIKYSRPSASKNEVIAAMKKANCGFVSTLEGGLDYEVGRNGHRLSGGQRQRIGLARAFLADPRFLILDEPSSAMDLEGESALKDAMVACRSSHRGLLVISHKSKTLNSCDRILVLKDGKLVQEGKVENLQKDEKGEFVSLMAGIVVNRLIN